MKWIVVDLDNTLCNDEHRQCHIATKDWNAYHESINGDPPNKDVLHTLHIMIGPVNVMILTSRPEDYRKVTEDWLHANEAPYDVMLMRPSGDFIDSTVHKIRALEEFFGSREEVIKNVLFVLEDRNKLVKTFREYGLPCWQVREGNF